jgi:hypothetical protein
MIAVFCKKNDNVLLWGEQAVQGMGSKKMLTTLADREWGLSHGAVQCWLGTGLKGHLSPGKLQYYLPSKLFTRFS